MPRVVPLKRSLFLVLLALSLLIAAPAFGQFCSVNPDPEKDSMVFSSTIPGYPNNLLEQGMEQIIRDQFQGDQDGGGVDTACCYEPDIQITPISLIGCDIITSSNVISCFDALGAGKVGIVEQILECAPGPRATRPLES